MKTATNIIMEVSIPLDEGSLFIRLLWSQLHTTCFDLSSLKESHQNGVLFLAAWTSAFHLRAATGVINVMNFRNYAYVGNFLTNLKLQMSPSSQSQLIQSLRSSPFGQCLTSLKLGGDIEMQQCVMECCSWGRICDHNHWLEKGPQYCHNKFQYPRSMEKGPQYFHNKFQYPRSIVSNVIIFCWGRWESHLSHENCHKYHDGINKWA